MQFLGHLVDGLRRFGIGLELQLLLVEVVIGLHLLELRLPVLADHHEDGQEFRLQGDDLVEVGRGLCSAQIIQTAKTTAWT